MHGASNFHSKVGTQGHVQHGPCPAGLEPQATHSTGVDAKWEAHRSPSQWRLLPACALSPAQATPAMSMPWGTPQPGPAQGLWSWGQRAGRLGRLQGEAPFSGLFGAVPSWLTLVSQPLMSSCRTFLRPGQHGGWEGDHGQDPQWIRTSQVPRCTVNPSELALPHGGGSQPWLAAGMLNRASPESSQPQRGQACGPQTLTLQPTGQCQARWGEKGTSASEP